MKTDKGSDTGREQFLDHLRDALNHLYEPHRLRQNPLADAFGVANRFDTASALRRILIEAVESLAPPPDEPVYSLAWQLHGALLYRYVEQMTQPEVADQLNLSVRHLRRRERDALEALVDVLCGQFGAEITQSRPAPDERYPPANVIDAALSQELAWVRDAGGTTDLAETLPGLLNLARGLAEQYEAQLEVSVPAHLPHLAVGPVVVRQALLNVLGVAIRRASRGRVVFSARYMSPAIEFRVQSPDYPAGLKPMLEDETAALNVAERLATLCGGRLALAVDSRSYDATLAFPVVEQLPILVIDDNADTLELLQRYTSGTRYRLITTQNPEEGLGLAERLSPRAIVLDVMMPEIDGWQVVAQLKQNPTISHIPTIVCTILPQKEWARLLGVDAFIRKPLTRETFLSTLAHLLKRAEQELH